MSATGFDGGYLCTVDEFGIDNMPLYGDDDSVYEQLEELVKGNMVFDLMETHLLRAPFEELRTDIENAETVFCIAMNPEEIDMKKAGENARLYDKKK